jgi:hypothetical protein
MLEGGTSLLPSSSVAQTDKQASLRSTLNNDDKLMKAMDYTIIIRG